MTFGRLLLRCLLFHWRSNLAVMLGVFVGAAVLTGALVVGDSLRGSLRAQALDQLGWVDHALVTNRLFTADLAKKLPASKVSPAISMQCSASTAGPQPLHARKVTLLAVNQEFWRESEMPLDASFWQSDEHAVALNRALADRLNAKVGDKVIVLLQSNDNVPRETLIGKRKSDDVLSKLEVTVKAIVPDAGMGRFTLRPSPQKPLTAFVPLRLIQQHLDGGKKTAPAEGRINAVFVGGGEGEKLQKSLAAALTLIDWNLELLTPKDRAEDLFKLLAAGEDQRPNWNGKLRKYRWNGRISEDLADEADDKGDLTKEQFVQYFRKWHNYLSLESGQVYIESAIVAAAERAATALGWQIAPTIAYMMDTLSDGKNEAPYVIVAALDTGLAPPLGPLKPAAFPRLEDDEILIARWPGCPLQLEKGQSLTLSYDVPDNQGNLERRLEKMRFAGWLELQGAADDPYLTPRFEGITDRLSIREWADDLPFPVDRRRLKRADHDYWDRYRATPKAYVNLATGQRLWGSRFGDVTSVRLTPASDGPAELQAGEFLRKFEMDLESGGFVFENTKERALLGGQGSSDFGLLFLGFSSFLIAAALLLVGLMFRLSLDRRAGEMGLLLAVGFGKSKVRRLALAEGVVLSVVGGMLGVGGAVVIARLLLNLLGFLWPGGLERSLLRVHAEWRSLALGFISSLVISGLTIWWTTRTLAKSAPRSLLSGTLLAPANFHTSRWRFSALIMCAGAIAASALAIGGSKIDSHEAQALCFFGSGIAALTAFLAGFWWGMRRAASRPASTMPQIGRLGIRNASRHPVRSVLTVGLLASATFVVVAVQAFHRDSGHDFFAKTGGSGGFAWIGEATIPIFQDLNTPDGRKQQSLPVELPVQFVSFRLQAGDDASCLNLYKTQQPRILGVPRELINRGGFSFAGSEREARAGETEDPWKLLLKPLADGVIPAIGEANTVKYMLHSGLGKEIEVVDGSGKPKRLRIVGLLQDSVFQGELLIAENMFLKLFPRQEGFQFFLIDAPPPPQGEGLRRTMETALAGYGFSMTPSRERLQSYLDVENTYLATFQALGGLGLLLGTLGLAVVLVRSVWERRGELALLRAVGFRRSALSLLVLAENAWLLVLGLAFGWAAATVAVAPFLLGHSADLLQWQLVVLIGLVIVVGLGVGALAVRSTLGTPLLPALRKE